MYICDACGATERFLAVYKELGPGDQMQVRRLARHLMTKDGFSDAYLSFYAALGKLAPKDTEVFMEQWEAEHAYP